MEDLPFTHFWQMDRNPMADKFNALVAGRPGSEGNDRYCYAAALVFYRKDSGFRNIPQSLKYHANMKSGRYFAEMLGKKLSCADWFGNVDAVIPVPLHWRRRWRRGYNQAEVIARSVAAELKDVPVLDILVRKRATRTQTMLDAKAKAANVRGAFGVRKRKKTFTPGHVLLVDDVFTTGATLSECYNALRDCFGYGMRISVATLAYASD